MIARFDRGGVGGKSNVVFFQRPDLGGRGIGVIAFLQGTGRCLKVTWSISDSNLATKP